jgi:hypothetical protein
MAVVADGGVSSCGSINMRRIDHLLPLPLPCIGEPTAASRVSRRSSPARSDAFEGTAAFYAADAEPDPDPEASAGRSMQMLLAKAGMGARGGPYGRRPASSYGSYVGSLTEHRPGLSVPHMQPEQSYLPSAAQYRVTICCIRVGPNPQVTLTLPKVVRPTLEPGILW